MSWARVRMEWFGNVRNDLLAGVDYSGSFAAAAAQLTKRGFTVKTHIQPGRPDQAIASYSEANAINLLVVGAYGHSRIRNLVIGSTTSATLRSCRVPVFLFR